MNIAVCSPSGFSVLYYVCIIWEPRVQIKRTGRSKQCGFCLLGVTRYCQGKRWWILSFYTGWYIVKLCYQLVSITFLNVLTQAKGQAIVYFLADTGLCIWHWKANTCGSVWILQGHNLFHSKNWCEFSCRHKHPQ